MTIFKQVMPINNQWQVGSPCIATGGFTDIYKNGTIVLRNTDNQIVAVSELEEGRLGIILSYWVCTFDFSLATEDLRDFQGCRFLLDGYRQKIATSNCINLSKFEPFLFPLSCLSNLFDI
ncbi:hypothetical protein H6G48_07235 [Microcystis flos-aquae FACHB-1344]|uniref:Uncharacterized protein n=1 Tax=Microcystis flos-aquae FACHB-1344 TaxID=2692899 RepID=A0ABR8HRV6_9CHRO|nr:hypothetical protein [Microcystis flos-aquae]MBD2621476.1 hypothetical protein [Microcystis flos-aquae FACHB-1344]